MVAECEETLHAIEVLKEIGQQYRFPKSFAGKLNPLIKDLKKASRLNLKKLLSPPELSGGWPTWEDVDLMKAFKERLLSPHNTLELTLCKSRQVVYTAFQQLVEAGVAFRASQGALLEQEKERHLIHREEERKAELKRLQDLLKYYRVQVQLQSEGKLKGSTANFDYTGEIEKVESKIKKIQAYTDHDLLSDRLLFSRD